MRIDSSADFDKDLREIAKTNPKIEEKIKRKLDFFAVDRNYPSLRLHKLQGKLKEFWSISITEDLRVIFDYTPDGIILLHIGKHEEVY